MLKTYVNKQKRTLWTYYLFKATKSYGFIVPFTVVYIRHQGYGLDVIGFTQSAFLVAVVAAEIPAGYVADRIGRRRTLAIGNVLVSLAFATFTFVDSAAGWVALYAFWGVAWSFHSAIGDAWLYAFLERVDEAGEFARTNGRGHSVELAVSAVTALVSGGLFVLNPDFPFFANAGLAALGVPTVLLLPSGQRESSVGVSVSEVLHVIRVQLARPEIRWLVVYMALFNALFSATRWLEQPTLEAISVPVVAFGALYATFKLVTAGAMMTTGWVQESLGPRRFFLLLAPVTALAYGTIAITPVFVLPVIYLRRVLNRVSGPIRNQYFNDRLDDVGRATVLSGVSMVLHLAGGVTSALFGPVAEATGPVTFLAVGGVTISVFGGLFWVVADPVRSGETAASTPTAAPSTD